MKLFINFLAVFVFLVSGIFSNVDAQAPVESSNNSQAAVLIADVNFSEVDVISTPSQLDLSFSVSSALGNPSGLTYGVDVRSKKTGAILASEHDTEVLNLKENVVVNRTFKYIIPTYLAEEADAYLVLKNEMGISLASYPVASLPAGANALNCVSADNNANIVCKSNQAGVLSLKVTKDSTQGEVVLESNQPLSVDSEYRGVTEQISEKFLAGAYVYTYEFKNDVGNLIGNYVFEKVKSGDFARILSINPQVEVSGDKTIVDIITYAEAWSTSDRQISLVADAGECGSSPTVQFLGKVENLKFETTCSEGKVEVFLKEGETVLDSMAGTFGAPKIIPVSETTNPTENPLVVVLLVLVALVLVVSIIVFFKKKHHNLPPIAMLLFIIAASFIFVPKTFAATYVIGGQATFDWCQTRAGINCSEPGAPAGGRAYITAGTVTVPARAIQGKNYSVSVTQSLASSLRTTCNGVVCGPTEVKTSVYANLPAVPSAPYQYVLSMDYYNTLPIGLPGSINGIPVLLTLAPGTVSGSFMRTAPLAGVADNLSTLQIADSLGGLTQTLVSDPLTWPYVRSNISVALFPNVVPAGSCDAGCEGSIIYRPCPTCKVIDFTCPAGTRMVWAGSCPVNPVGLGGMACVPDVMCNTGNTSPTADAGIDRNITLPVDSLTIAGANAGDADGSVSGVSWSQFGGPSPATIAGGNSLTPTFSNLVTGVYVFMLTVTDNLGATTKNTMLVTVDPGAALPPNIDFFTPSAPSVVSGTSPTLTWNVVGATSCTINQGIGPVNNVGGVITNPTVTPIIVNTSYTLSCMNGAVGPTEVTVPVSVAAPTAPIINSFNGTPSVVSGGTPNLDWNVSDVTSCTINQGIGAVAPAAGGSVGAPTVSAILAPTTYTLSCMNGAAGPTTRDFTVTIIAGLPAPTINSFTGTPSVVSGGTPTLNWNVTDVTRCSINQGIGLVAPAALGSVGGPTVSAIVTPTTYRLSCWNGVVGPTIRDFTVNISSGNVMFNPNPCFIDVGDSTCAVSVSWNSNSFVGGTEISQGAAPAFSTVPTSAEIRNVSPIDRTFTLKDTGSAYVESFTVEARCNSLSVWVLALGICAPLPVINATADPAVIRSGQTATLNIVVDSVYNLTCTINDGGAAVNFLHNGNALPQKHSRQSRPLTAAQVVNIKCTSVPHPLITGSGDTRVSVVPTYQEI
jgi:hypothetical protein